MKLRVLSDLHLEFERMLDFSDYTPFDPPAIDADVVVLAGDIASGADGIAWAHTTFPKTPVVLIAGNHEFYGRHFLGTLDRMREYAQMTEGHVHFLENDAVVIDGVRFLGATLWTDFEFDGSIERSMDRASNGIADFRRIRHAGEYMTPQAQRELHIASRAWLTQQLSEPFEGKTVVVTHHLPHALSVHRRFVGSALTPAFASRLDALVRPPVDLWIHGHSHSACDYTIEGTRVVSNQRGYPTEFGSGFDSALVVEI